ncbi:MAG: O-antigen ligase family protein [Acidobacteriaceae bacterium]
MESAINIPKEEAFEIPQATGLAFAVGFYFSFRIAIALFCVRVLGAEPRTGAEASLALDFVLLVLAGFHSLGAASSPSRTTLRLPCVRWVVVFLAFSFCSLAWSGTVSLSTSFVYWCGMAADVVIVLLLLRGGGAMQGTATALMKGFVVSACCLAVVAWMMPAQPDLRLGDEEFFNANQIGNLCAFAIFMAQYLMRGRKMRWTLAALFLTITLVRSLSKTTIVAFLISESFLVIQDESMSRKTKAFMAAIAVGLVLVFWGLLEAYYGIYTTTGNQAETLTGRTAIWAYILSSALEKPWIGHGFDSMWKVIPAFGPDRFEARHAENELLQQFWAYGAAGLTMLAGVYGGLIRQIRRRAARPGRGLFLAILLYVLVRGLAEAEPFDLLLPLWMAVLFSLLIEDGSATEIEAPEQLLTFDGMAPE